MCLRCPLCSDINLDEQKVIYLFIYWFIRQVCDHNAYNDIARSPGCFNLQDSQVSHAFLVLIFQALYHVFWGRGRKGSNGSHNGILFRFMQKDFSKKGNGTDCWRSRGLSLYLWWDLYFFSALRNLVPVLFIGLNKNNVVILKQECWCFV